MFLSLLMRIHLIWPGAALPILARSSRDDLTLVTMHGTIMVFFVLTTAPQGGFGNYSCHSDRRARHGLSRFEHALVLDDFLGFIVMIAAFFRRRRSTSGMVGPVRAAECSAICRPR